MAALAILLAAGGALWNWAATQYYREHYPAPGKMYTVNGHSMHLYCTGSGSPTLILDSGLGDDWTVWQKVQPTLSKTTRVCSYDRSGLGWSDELSPEHDANTLADQLHALLQAADIRKPIILMGHSMAGVYDRAYIAHYPGDVAGMIFVDASSPDQFKRFPPQILENLQSYYSTRLKWLTVFGIARATGKCEQIVPGLEFERGFIYANNCKISVVDTNFAEFNDIDHSSDETRHTGPFSNLPILVMTEDPQIFANTDSDSIPPEIGKKSSILWESMQEDLKHLSSNGRRIIAKGSGHYVEVDRADLINREVPVFIQQVRSGQVPADNGTTKVE
ncbi:alpha/beta hydrolase [Dyella flava]|uniref:Alpha/beta hydrolase n=1 Tax=Dyella flava TaxID=1920170 RepID=A0ABS2JZ96_9GAMM|nr:alpha/beta hydrolase [Dyella flava]